MIEFISWLSLPLQDTNPIFLFSLMAIESATPPSASVNYGSGKSQTSQQGCGYLNTSLDGSPIIVPLINITKQLVFASRSRFADNVDHFP